MRSRQGASLILALLVATASGCDRTADRRVVVATSWPDAERGHIAEAFARRLAKGDGARGPIAIDWLVLDPGDDRQRLAERRDAPDVLLGGPSRDFERLAAADRLRPLSKVESAVWAVVRRGEVRLEESSRAGAASARLEDRGEVAFDDPRIDPISLAWAEAQLSAARFGEGYAWLVRAAGCRRRVGSRSGAAAAAVARGEADRAPVVVFELGESPATGPKGIPWLEGVAILRSGRNLTEAEAFVRVLASEGRLTPVPGPGGRTSLAARELLAALLGATLVDAQDELREAWESLDRNGSPAKEVRWMTEPPPWPPASVAKLLAPHDEAAMRLVDDLAGQVAPEAAARGWLVRSWLSPPRTIDRDLLEELSGASDGTLVRERRFREWLRAEWTAWARQRYRRVSRVVEGRRPP
ncbi:MAG: hypothetical protein ACYC61_07785 [Isosphaeraceae bacterium]